MTSFAPGDRVTDGRYIGFVEEVRGDYAVIKDPRRIMRVSINMKYLRPAYQTCKDCDVTGWVYYVGGGDCLTCRGTGRINRTGPYKLQSGEWSDGVKRAVQVNSWKFGMHNPRRYHVVCQREIGTDEWSRTADVFIGELRTQYGKTYSEAIASAHKAAKEVADVQIQQ